MQNNFNDYNGYAVFCHDKKPLGVVSLNGERTAHCDIRKLPKSYRQYLTAIEDKRFYQHGAIDIKAITRALYENIKTGKVVQGGSTITQQLARNILRDNRKSFVRKLKEIFLALELEKKYSKEEILELYFNKVFWGKKIYGLRAASLEYFSKEPQHLNTAEQLGLLTFLRGPNYYLKNEDKFLKRYDLLSRTLYNRKVITAKKISKIKKAEIQIHNNNLEIFKNDSIPFIADNVSVKHRSIISSLNKEIQNEATRFITNCKYPTSIICISNGKVIVVASSNGSDYPFTFKTNVGSTLKPFIYTFLRENGINADDQFSTTNIHNLNWNIREVQKSKKDFLTLKGGLLLSNNNVFVNASYQFGIEKVLSFLATVTNKPTNNFVPASVLGASIEGISLYELVNSYYNFFQSRKDNLFAQESISILKEIAIEKFECEFYNSFLKTGTTNFNRERFAIVGYAKSLFGFLRQDNEVDDYSKEGNFISNILSFLKGISKRVYKW